MEWLVIWGVQQLAGFAFREILENVGNVLGDLTKEAGKDFVKDFFKDSLKSGINKFKKDALAEAMGKAIAQFLYLVQQELEASGIRKADIVLYTPALQKFIYNKSVKAWLAKAFEPGCQSLDGRFLQDVWAEMKLKPLPEDFSWGKLSRVYLNRVEDIIGESQELKDLFSAKQLKDIKDNTQQLVGIVPDFDLERYRESIRESYGYLKLNAIDPTDRQYRVRLWNVFVPQNVREALPPSRYELPKEVQRALQEAGLLEAGVSLEELERYKQIFLEKPVQSVLEILRDSDCPYVVILGDPGSGKSSLLQYLALDWAENPTPKLPLLIELRDYARDENTPKDFLGFFHQGKRKICELNELALDQQLRSGNALVMFDGLDEIFDPEIRNRIITEIHNFTNKYKRVRVIVTSRIVGYNSERLTNAGFQHFTLEDLNEKQIRDFLKKWHKLALIDESDRERSDIQKRLQDAIKESTAIKELAGNPLLLTMMAILNRRQELPRKRADLYEEAAKVLLHQWDIEYKKIQLTLDDVDLRAKQAMLCRVAYYMQASKEGLKGNIIHRDELEAALTGYLRLREINNPLAVAGKIIDQLRVRNFILCHLGNEYYAFVHRTFLEYFCAMEFVNRFNKRGLDEGLTIEQLQTEVFGQHWQDKSWHEVLRLIVGKIDSEFVGAIIEFLVDIQINEEEKEDISHLLLAADCFSEVSSKSKIAKASAKLLSALKEALGTSKDKQIIARKIAFYWKDNPDAMAWLEERALNHENQSVRQAIAKGVASVELPDLNLISITDLGDLYIFQNRYEEAIATYLRGVEITFVMKAGLIAAYQTLKKFDEAIAYCNQWIEKEPKSLLAYSQLGSIYRDADRYNDAISAFNRALEIAGKNITATLPLSGLGWTYHNLGKYEEAISTYNRAIEIDSNSQFTSTIFSNLGMVYHDLGQHSEAISAFNQALEIDSKHSKTYNNLGYLYRNLEQWEDAVKAFHCAIEINPQYSNAYRNLGMVYLIRGDVTQAEKEFTTAIQIDPLYGNGVLSMGLLQAVRGNLQEARVTWKKGLELYGEHAQRERLFRTLYVIAMEHSEQGIANLQQILTREKPPVGLLHQVLETARILQQCPEFIPSIDTAVALLHHEMQRNLM
ncbi:tetratricopeptide repeat protein [Fischerella sp. PCC 9605]|uniref:tetratricopeptide repeat protein n=1 Tax=Fischerella sp. PCC 9605 TaxID=1173024 RepID=UPI0004BC9DE6|nr:tetratricopeptide repeat protein [Fischerella sp. PCC 9605]